MIIDGHAHACGKYLTADSIQKTLDANGAEKVILVPGELHSKINYPLLPLAKLCPFLDVVPPTNFLTKIIIPLSGKARDIPEGNRYVRSLVQACPERIIQFFWPLLSREGIMDEIRLSYETWRYSGLKLHQCWDKFSVRSKTFEEFVEFSIQKKLPVFFHLGSYREVRYFIDFLKAHSDAVFIIGHLYGLELYIKSGISLENLYFDISTPPLISKYRIMKAIKYFGASRVVMGSDTPYGRNTLSKNIKKVNLLPISDEEKAMVLGLNLVNLLGLK